MDSNAQRLRFRVAGVGSPHGDDQAGWRLIDQLSLQTIPQVVCKKVAAPHELIDWMDDCGTLHIVDACVDMHSVARIDTNVHDLAIVAEMRPGSSHHLELSRVLQLAEVLDRLPSRVVLWLIPGASFKPFAQPSESCLDYVRQCAEMIRREIADE